MADNVSVANSHDTTVSGVPLSSGGTPGRLRKRPSFGTVHHATAPAGSAISPIDEQFVSQIVLTPTPLEQPLSNVLRAIFTAGRAPAFMDTLAEWSERKEQEIEAACLEGYGLFVPTVETVLGRVREHGTVLDARVTTLRDELSSAAQQIYDTRLERYEARKMLLNVGRAVQALEDCLRALDLVQRIGLEIGDGNFHEAVKLIDELQGRGVLRAVEEMVFYHSLETALAALKRRVWDAATGQVKRWFGQVRDDSAVMGSLALAQIQTRIEQHARLQDTASVELFLLKGAPDDAATITQNDLVAVDFGPLQDALRLFAMMDREAEFAALLLDTRRVQAELILGARVSLERPDADPRSLRAFLNALSGFFIFERLLVRLPQGCYPLAHLEARWEAAQMRIREVALESLRLSSSDRGAFMKIKWQLVFFTHCMDMFSYPVAPLVDTILVLFYRYVDLLRTEAIDRGQLAIGRLSHAAPESVSADCLQAVSHFLSSFSVFLDGVPACANRRADFAELARRTVDDHILAAIVRACAEETRNPVSPTSAHINLLRLLTALEEMCMSGGAVVRLLAADEHDNGAGDGDGLVPSHDHVSLNVLPLLETTRMQLLARLRETIGHDIDAILNRLSYERNPSVRVSSPTSVIQELTRHLTQLDTPTLRPLWPDIFAHISAHFDAKILADVRYPHLNALFFHNLNVDLTSISTQMLPLASLPGNPLQPLASLIELCNLMAADSVHEFLDPVVRQRKYSHLETDRLISVLERVKEPADKRQSVEDLIMLLK